MEFKEVPLQLNQMYWPNHKKEYAAANKWEILIILCTINTILSACMH